MHIIVKLGEREIKGQLNVKVIKVVVKVIEELQGNIYMFVYQIMFSMY